MSENGRHTVDLLPMVMGLYESSSFPWADLYNDDWPICVWPAVLMLTYFEMVIGL